MVKTAAIIGSGVIGAGWAARFLLAGWHVRVHDPAPEAEARLFGTIARARASLPGLYDTPLPAPGRLSLHPAIPEAVAGVDWIHEAVPEMPALKHEVLREIQATSPHGVTLASATAGLSLGALRDGALRPGEILLACAQDPVYLLPLVELVTAPEDEDRRAAAGQVVHGLGMVPVYHTGPRAAPLVPALRAALRGSAQDRIAGGTLTPAEVDAAIGLSLGPLWAQMGPFEAEDISRAPTTDAAATLGRRDANLVGVLRALKAERRGAGAALAATDAARAPAPGVETAPLLTAARTVPTDWADYNGHMTEARYLHAFGNATDRFMEILGVDADYLASGGSFFTAETHIRHLAEVRIGAALEIRTICLSGAGKRMHLWHEMRSDGRLVATGEHMLIHVSLATRRPAPPVPPVADNLARIARAHARLARASGVGRAIGDPR